MQDVDKELKRLRDAHDEPELAPDRSDNDRWLTARVRVRIASSHTLEMRHAVVFLLSSEGTVVVAVPVLEKKSRFFEEKYGVSIDTFSEPRTHVG